MAWGGSGGGGIGQQLGSPEHGRAVEAGRDRRPSPDPDPPRRPGCLVTLAAVLSIPVGIGAIVWVANLVADLLG